MRPAALSVEELAVGFNERSLIEHFSLSLSEGDKVTVTGSSGSGKSTLLRCIVGFVSPHKGSIHVKGERVSETTIWRLRCLMAYVIQEPELGAGSVRSILEEPFGYRANAGLRSNLEHIPELFERLLLPLALLDQEMSKLSGGEKQRIAIIGALLLQREILLLDEATSALDKGAQLALTEYLMAQDNLTILSVAHDPADLPLSGDVVALRQPDDNKAMPLEVP
jgi:ABC-type iron transport system FetAB ATPase subunit